MHAVIQDALPSLTEAKPAPKSLSKTITETPALPIDLEAIVHVLTCGSVDDGKSTLIGRLLWDATHLHEDQRARIERSAGPDGVPDFSLLVDGLLAEREQGITIDIAWRFVDAGVRRLVFVDSPGHEQYTRNMASGASHVDAAIMLVDARQGVKRQTRRHAAILALVGVRRVILAVNKMDLVDFSEARFREIEREFAALTAQFQFDEANAVPISAKHGDNVVNLSGATPWFSGPTILDHLNASTSAEGTAEDAFRFPVQMAIRSGVDFRGLAGTVASGRVAVGDLIVEGGSEREAKVRRIVTMTGDLPVATSGDAVVLELDRDLDITRGAVLADKTSPPKMANSFEGRLVWLADTPMQPNQSLLLRTATDLTPVAALDVITHLDLVDLAEKPANGLAVNEIATVSIKLGRLTAMDLFSEISATGRFILADALTGATVAGGVITSISTTIEDVAMFQLSDAVLLSGICDGLEPNSAEFAARAEAALDLLLSAGVAATRVSNERSAS